MQLNRKPAKPVRLLRWLTIAGILWGQLVLILGTIQQPTPENLTLLFSIETAGLYTLMLLAAKNIWIGLSRKNPIKFSILLGSFNAAVIETEFWAFEKLFGATGVAASSNLLIDLLITMPWYIGIVWLFVLGYRRSRFSPEVVLMLGGLYEIGGDGIVGGQIIPVVSGETINLLSSWGFLLGIAFWQFILVYSSIVLPPAWVIENSVPHDTQQKPIRDALLPLLWVFPYSVFAVAVLILIFGNP